MDYLQLLKHSYIKHCEYEGDTDVYSYLDLCVFDFTTYDDQITALFSRKALEVCDVINRKATFEYIQDEENYKWYLIMANTCFFKDKLNWGTSIRGAWWDDCEYTLDVGCFYIGDDYIKKPIKLVKAEWMEFVSAMVEFVKQ